MRNKLFVLLAAAVVGKCVAPAAAQVPDFAVPERARPTISASYDIECEPALWFAFHWGQPGLGIGGEWVHVTAEPGPLMQFLAPPVLPAHDDAVAAKEASDDFADPFRLEIIEGAHHDADAPNDVGGYDRRDAHYQFAIKGISSPISQPALADGQELPASTFYRNCGDGPGVQFCAGAGVCVMSLIGANGHLNFNSQNLCTGSSMWLGCSTTSGVGLQASFSVFAGAQFMEFHR